MKRTVSLTLALLLVFSAVAAFAGGSKEGGAAASSSSGGKVSLSMFMYRDVTAPEAKVWADQILPTFLKENPDISITPEYLFNDPYHQKLQAMAVSGQLPDIVFLWPDKRTGYVTERGLMKDLRPFLKGHESEFFPLAVAPQTGKNGEIYELPEQITATQVTFTNTKLLKQLGLTYPKTVDEMIAQGDKIRAAGLVPIAMANKDGWEMQSCLLSTLVDRTGGMDWFKKAVAGDGSMLADPQFVAALNVVKKLNDAKMFSPGINQLDYNNAIDSFVAEKAVYLVDGGWRVNNLVQTLTPDQKKYIELNSFPDVAGEVGPSGSTSAVAGTGFGMNAKLDGAKADAAWKWIWYYSGPEGSKIRLANGAFPAYKLDLSSIPNVDPMIVKLSDFWKGRDTSLVIDSVLSGQAMSILQPGMQEMMFGNKTPQQLATEFANWLKANPGK